MNSSSYTLSIFFSIIAILYIIPASQALECYTSYHNTTSNVKTECTSHNRCFITATYTNKTIDLGTVSLGCANSTQTNRCMQGCTKRTTDATKYDCGYCCAGALCNNKNKDITMDDFKNLFTSDAVKASGMATAILSLVYLSLALIMN